MSDQGELARRLAEVLSTDIELRREGVRLVVRALLAQPVGDLVTPTEARELVLASVTAESVSTTIERHISPAWDRHRARAEASGETVGDLLPEGGAEELRAIVAKVRPPRAEWAQGAVDRRLVSKLLAPVVQDTLMAFARKLPGLGFAADGGRVLGGIAGALRKRAEKGTEKLGDVRKSVMGGFDKKVNAVARDFSQGAVAPMRKAFISRLRSEEGQQLIERIVREVIDKLLAATVAELMSDADAALPRETLEAFAAKVVLHNVGRAEIAATVQAELAAAMAAEAGRTVADVLDDAGIRERTEELLTERLSHLLGPFLGSDGFVDWLGRVLEAASE
jgi:hypothetical protein